MSGSTNRQYDQQQHLPSEDDEDITLNSEINPEEDGGNQQNENWQPRVQVNKVSQKFVRKFHTQGFDNFVRIENLEGQNGERLHFDSKADKFTSTNDK